MSMEDNHSRTVSSDCEGMASILKTSLVKSCKNKRSCNGSADQLDECCKPPSLLITSAWACQLALASQADWQSRQYCTFIQTCCQHLSVETLPYSMLDMPNSPDNKDAVQVVSQAG